MALSDILSDIYAALSLTEIHAEAPPEEEEKDEDGDDDKGESDSKEGEEGGDEEGEGGSDEGGDDEEEEEEEEEEEPEDPFPKLQEGTPLPTKISCVSKRAGNEPRCCLLRYAPQPSPLAMAFPRTNQRPTTLPRFPTPQ